MKKRNQKRAGAAQSWMPPKSPLFPARGNLPKPTWRGVLTGLAGPAMRVHKYRNLRSAMFYDAMCDYDCGKPT